MISKYKVNQIKSRYFKEYAEYVRLRTLAEKQLSLAEETCREYLAAKARYDLLRDRS